ncbi:HD domain-containing protein [Clostridium pasteurianum]|uniref:HD domain-containing protein n=1 Tax=Clostridium pasteurianum TaxID=1501 RepID=UPI002260E321|nr:HD domain-containing protein [Clostridium pasteurianum]UZW14417.1 HD domain-containing protein [Clostridium pasteurianum]
MINLIRKMEEIFKSLNGEAYLVDGYVIEKLIKPSANIKKIDIMYKGNIDDLFKLSKENLNYNIRLYNNEKMLIIEDNRNTLKIIELINKDIEEYLKDADYTMNAISVKLIDNKIIDPYQGRNHIKRRIIQEVNDKSIENHPLAILKGINYYIKYGMHFSIDTELHIRQQRKRLRDNYKSKLLKELMNIINADKTGVAFNVLDQYSILENLLPYINELKSIGKCKYHIEDVFTHMNTSYEVLKDIQYGKIKLKGLDIDIFNRNIDGYNLIDFLALTVFLHDIGKYKTYKKDNIKVSFINHDVVGKDIMKDVCKELYIPKAAEDIICNVIEAHMYPLKLFNIKDDIQEFNKELNLFINRYGEYYIYITIASYCDIIATTTYYDPDNKAEEYKSFIEKLLKIK